MLKITIENQSLTLSDEVVAENSAEFATFCVQLSPEWDGYSVTVRFRAAADSTVYDVANVASSEEYFIPAEVLRRGRVYVSAVGVKGSCSVATATRESFEVKGALVSGEGTVPTVTPNAYAQYVKLVTDRSEEVNTAAELAGLSAKQAEVSRIEAERNAQASKSDSDRASSYASRAEESAASAVLSAAEAKSASAKAENAIDGLDAEAERIKAELDTHGELKKSDIDDYAEKTCLEVEDYADALKKDFSADARIITTNFDINYAEKTDAMNKRADDIIAASADNAASAEKAAFSASEHAAKASDSASSAAVCKNQTLNALASVLVSEQNAADSAQSAAASSRLAADNAASALNSASELKSACENFYTKSESDGKFALYTPSFQKGESLYLKDADLSAEFDSFTVFGSTLRSHIPSSTNPCEIYSFPGRINICGENVLNLDNCTFSSLTRDDGVLHASLDSVTTYGEINADFLIPFLRAGCTYTFTAKSDSVSDKEKTAVKVGENIFLSDASTGAVCFTVPYCCDITCLRIYLSYFEDKSLSTQRDRTFTCVGLNRGINPVYAPYSGYVMDIGEEMNAVTVYNGRNGNPASKICDTLSYKNGVLTLTKRIGKKVLTGESNANNNYELWDYLLAWEKPDTIGFYTKLTGKGNYPVICDHFDYNGTTSEALTEQIACNGAVEFLYIQIKKSSIDGWSPDWTVKENIAKMREWVSRNNITVYYVLNEPVETVVSTGTLRPDVNIYADFEGVRFEAEYKPARPVVFPCNGLNTESGKSMILECGTEKMPFECIEIKGVSSQRSTPAPDSPVKIEGFGNAVMSYNGANHMNYSFFTAKNAVCKNGVVKVTVPKGAYNAVLFDETLNYSLEGGKTYTFTAECDSLPVSGEKVAVEINGKVYYSEEKSRSVTFTVPNVYNEKKVKIYLCCSETPWSDEQTRVYGALRITRGDTVVPYTPYDGALIYIPGILDVDGFSADTVLRACGEIYDRIYVREGIAVLEKNISYITLDGTEKYTYKDEYSTDSTAAFRLKPYKYSYGKVYSSHFAGLDESSLYTDGADGIYAAEDGIIVRILKSRLENYENAATDDAREMLFGKWISDTASVTLQYVQNYPEIIDITDTAPARDLLALRTTPGTGYLSTVFDTINTVSYGTVPGDIFCTYPCEITDLIEFKIARALGKAV